MFEQYIHLQPQSGPHGSRTALHIHHRVRGFGRAGASTFLVTTRRQYLPPQHFDPLVYSRVAAAAGPPARRVYTVAMEEIQEVVSVIVFRLDDRHMDQPRLPLTLLTKRCDRWDSAALGLAALAVTIPALMAVSRRVGLGGGVRFDGATESMGGTLECLGFEPDDAHGRSTWVRDG